MFDRDEKHSRMSLFDLTGKVALVTGSTRGIGEAIVRRLAEHGAKVVVSSRKAEACERMAHAINDAQRADVALPAPCNINYKEQLQALVATTREKWGRIDVLVCNAALNPYFLSLITHLTLPTT
jgi:NAD(P)-dependent dehydrogenase (short-subunit alcohol dehydrogenase family)